MKIQITNEQPFQVLGTTFTIGPSDSGYDLYFSADGKNYSKLFTVGANVNRQVTQVAAGSYYLLSGNTDTVTVNWMGDCWGGSGSGGGSYVLPVASSDTLGGIKVGEGLSIDENGVLSSEGGGSGDAEMLIATSDLDELTAEAGDVAAKRAVKYEYVKFPWSGVTFSGTDIIELGNLFVMADVDNETDVLSLSNDYEPDPLYIVNEGEEQRLTNGDGTVWHVELDENGIVSISLENEDTDIIPIEEELLSLNECEAYFDAEVFTPDGLYQYDGEEWKKLGPRVILLNNLSQSELLDLYDELTAMYDYDNMAFTSAFNASNYAFYLDLTDSTKQNTIGVYDRNYEGWFPVLLNYVNPNDYDGGAIYFTGVEGRQDGNGYLYNIRFVVTNHGETEANAWVINPPQLDQYNIQITSGGTFENPDELNIFSSENYNHKVMFVWREDNGPGWGQCPLSNIWRKLDQSDNLIYYWTVDSVPIDGVMYKGAWHATENDWNNYTTDSWTTV